MEMPLDDSVVNDRQFFVSNVEISQEGYFCEHKKRPTVTVVLLSYNNAIYLEDALNALESQTYHDFEIIIGDDASSDNSLEILINFLRNSRHPALLIGSKKNAGIVKNYNLCVSRSRGAFIVNMASDDVSDRKRIEDQVNDLKEKKTSMSISSVRLIDKQGVCFGIRQPLRDRQTLASIMSTAKVSITSPTVSISVDLFKTFGLLPECVRNEDDILGAWALLRDGISVIDSPLVSYRVHTSSVMGRSRRQSLIQRQLRDYKNWRSVRLYWVKLLKEYGMPVATIERQMAIKKAEIAFLRTLKRAGLARKVALVFYRKKTISLLLSLVRQYTIGVRYLVATKRVKLGFPPSVKRY